MRNDKDDLAPQLISIFEQTVDNYPHQVAVICDEDTFTYAALDKKANQLAHFLIAENVHAGDIIGVLLPRSIESFIAMLAIYKIGGVYVPISDEYPVERINHILDDMNFALLFTTKDFLKQTTIHFPNTLLLQEIQEELERQSPERLSTQKHPNPQDPTCYVIYTSGSTGKPNGVEVGHRSICHYITVAAHQYGITQKDRIYQGFSLAFDASFEEIWMAFATGAALIVATKKEIRSGLGLIDFLNQHKITVLSTVPTLLASLSGKVASLRLLILGGEVCAPHVLTPWIRPGLTILNTYGPTEATVVATFSEYNHPSPITIGKPLPGYEIYLLDEHLKPVAVGQPGELCIAGAGLAKGYVNREHITAKKFIAHPDDPQKKLYRTGDLAQLDPQGDLLFLGRIDDQVKLRGFRLELNEIESLLMAYPGIKQAVVALLQEEEPKLVAYYTLEPKAKMNIQNLKKFLSEHLPAFMLPSIYEPLTQFPLLPSGKVNRKQLPLPISQPQTNPYYPPKSNLEKKIAQVMAEVLKLNKISIQDDFFYDLGMHSLTAATILSALRKLPECQRLSMLDLYQSRTIQALAKSIKRPDAEHRTKKKPFLSSSKWSYRGTTIAQAFGILLGYALSSWQILVFFFLYLHFYAHHSIFSFVTLDIFLAAAILVPVCSMLTIIFLKWLLLGKVKPGKYPLWGWFYLRWWLVSRLEAFLYPTYHIIGTPMIILYYRLLGAKIGKGCHIQTQHLGCHDLIEIGANTSINHDAVLKTYTIEDGCLHLAKIKIASDCYIGIRTVVSMGCQIGDHAAVENLSLVSKNSVIAPGEFYAGSPAKAESCPPNHTFKQAAHTVAPSAVKKAFWGFARIFAVFFVQVLRYGLYSPFLYGILLIYQQHSWMATLLSLPILGVAYVVVLCSMIVILKKAMLPVRSGQYSLHSGIWLKHWLIAKFLDLPEILTMADSLYFPFFLRCLGAKLSKDVETSEMSHVIPDLLTIQEHGFVAAYASIGASQVYHQQVFFDRVMIGKESFVGNRGVLPQGAFLQDGGLIACLSTMPSDPTASAVKHATWLGSPPILLPNRENPHSAFDACYQNPTLSMKIIRYSIEMIRILLPSTLTLLHFFLLFYVCMQSFSLAQLILIFPFAEIGIMSLFLGGFILLKWLLIGAYKPGVFPLWHLFIRRKDIVEYTYGYFIYGHIINLILGSPFMSMVLRLLGTKIGKYAYLESGAFEEFDLIHISDEVEINANAIIQTHLYEDRIFKMSNIQIDSRCNIGRDSIVLYDTHMETNSKLGSLSLLMKGETLAKDSNWEGCPAQAE